MIEYLSETGSTSSDLLQRLSDGERLPEGHWLVADRQSGGRGRQGRDWFDGVGNFMGSTVVHRHSGDPPADTLALVAGLALHEAVAWQLPGRAKLLLKWPNDLMAGDAKLAGILLERQGDAVVVGVGVNLVSAPEVPGRATAALSQLGTAPDRDLFAQVLARSFAIQLERWRTAGIAPVLRRWAALAHPEGTPLTVDEGGPAPLSGEYAGLGADGSLRLRLADGTLHEIHAGEVNLAE
ncbi:MAG: biotin--[acetyl-CoA-carboxylase] ligase [Alphaproteobacteria bacterium]|nr:biotin--[acetyl-CoA-carboxylase] ligase [Alphaproteobacteria bacterium]